MQRLTALDASFLHQERNGAHLHVGAIMICDGSAPARNEFITHITTRLERVPRYRQRLAEPPFSLGKPYWVDDPAFNLGYHVRYTALPAPGGEEELRELAGRIFSQRLDRTKPLWELWVVESLHENRFALINKTHHAVVDGVSGMDITTALFDVDKRPARSKAELARDWSPAPAPAPAELAAHAAWGAITTPLRARHLVAETLEAPGRVAGQVRRSAGGILEIARVMTTASSRTVINGTIGAHRDMQWVRYPLADLKAIKNSLGGTVNDVFLATIAGALRIWLTEQGESVDDVSMTACVPVSIRTDAERGALGNRIVGMFTPLPIDVADPAERMAAVTRSMQGLKESGQAVGADAIAAVQELAPPTILAQASRLQFSTALYNLLLSNVPGPQFALYVLGRELRSFIPVAFLAQDKRIAIAVVSYNGEAAISILSDSDHIHDLASLTAAVEASISELKTLAGKHTAARGRNKAAGHR